LHASDVLELQHMKYLSVTFEYMLEILLSLKHGPKS